MLANDVAVTYKCLDFSFPTNAVNSVSGQTYLMLHYIFLFKSSKADTTLVISIITKINYIKVS